jgi:hypothetical protein
MFLVDRSCFDGSVQLVAIGCHHTSRALLNGHELCYSMPLKVDFKLSDHGSAGAEALPSLKAGDIVCLQVVAPLAEPSPYGDQAEGDVEPSASAPPASSSGSNSSLSVVSASGQRLGSVPSDVAARLSAAVIGKSHVKVRSIKKDPATGAIQQVQLRLEDAPAASKAKQASESMLREDLRVRCAEKL